MTMLNEFKKFVKSSAFGRRLYPKLGVLYYYYKEPKRRKALKEHGYENLEFIMKIAEKEGWAIIPWAGTLLGFVRDGGFMPHDNDIDFALLPGNMPKDVARKLVEEYGCKFNQALCFQNRVCEFSVIKNDLGMDFFIMFDNGSEFFEQYDFFWKNDYPYTNPRQNHVGMYRYPRIDEFKKKLLKGIDIKIPFDVENELYYLYGKGWKVPDPNYKGEGRPGRIGTADTLGYSMTYDDLQNDRFNF